MSIIKPFRGICYDEKKVMDLSRVVCPPYDVINETEQDFYYQQSPYNFIRLILNKQQPNDDSANNRYARASVFFNEWLKTHVLQQDAEEAFYFYKQDYFVNGSEYTRLGFIALMQIQDEGAIFLHENTHHAPKMDRLELIKNVKANLTPIFTVFSDKKSTVKRIFENDLLKRDSDFCLKDTQGIRSSIWRVTDSKTIDTVTNTIKKNQIFIADGHHRYEVASMYRAMMYKKDKELTHDKGHNYIMTYFTALESKGLCIFPVHRVVKSAVDIKVLEIDFTIRKLNSLSELDEKIDSASKKECIFGFLQGSEAYLLKLKDKKRLRDIFSNQKCFQDLDIALLDNYVLGELLHVDKSGIVYTKEVREVKELLDSGCGSAAFLVRATTIQQIRNVALCGERMPPKSTYFYPKLLSGLVLHRFDE